MTEPETKWPSNVLAEMRESLDANRKTEFLAQCWIHAEALMLSAEAGATLVNGDTLVEQISGSANRTRWQVMESRVKSLFDAIQHGSVEHRRWLQQAITDHFAGKPVQGEEQTE